MRYTINGRSAGLISALGLALGQIFFVSCELFNLQSVVNLWYDLEPFLFALNAFFIFKALRIYFQDKCNLCLVKFKDTGSLFLLSLGLVLLNPSISSVSYILPINFTNLPLLDILEFKFMYLIGCFSLTAGFMDFFFNFFTYNPSISLRLTNSTSSPLDKLLTRWRNQQSLRNFFLKRASQIITVISLGITINSALHYSNDLFYEGVAYEFISKLTGKELSFNNSVPNPVYPDYLSNKLASNRFLPNFQTKGNLGPQWQSLQVTAISEKIKYRNSKRLQQEKRYTKDDSTLKKRLKIANFLSPWSRLDLYKPTEEHVQSLKNSTEDLIRVSLINEVKLNTVQKKNTDLIGSANNTERGKAKGATERGKAPTQPTADKEVTKYKRTKTRNRHMIGNSVEKYGLLFFIVNQTLYVGWENSLTFFTGSGYAKGAKPPAEDTFLLKEKAPPLFVAAFRTMVPYITMMEPLVRHLPVEGFLRRPEAPSVNPNSAYKKFYGHFINTIAKEINLNRYQPRVLTKYEYNRSNKIIEVSDQYQDLKFLFRWTKNYSSFLDLKSFVESKRTMKTTTAWGEAKGATERGKAPTQPSIETRRDAQRSGVQAPLGSAPERANYRYIRLQKSFRAQKATVTVPPSLLKEKRRRSAWIPTVNLNRALQKLSEAQKSKLRVIKDNRGISWFEFSQVSL